MKVDIKRSTKDKTVTVAVEMEPREKRKKEPIIRWRAKQASRYLDAAGIEHGPCLKDDFLSNDVSEESDAALTGEWIFSLVKLTTPKRKTSETKDHENIEII